MSPRAPPITSLSGCAMRSLQRQAESVAKMVCKVLRQVVDVALVIRQGRGEPIQAMAERSDCAFDLRQPFGRIVHTERHDLRGSRDPHLFDAGYSSGCLLGLGGTGGAIHARHVVPCRLEFCS